MKLPIKFCGKCNPLPNRGRSSEKSLIHDTIRCHSREQLENRPDPNKKLSNGPDVNQIADICDHLPNRVRLSENFKTCCGAQHECQQQCEHPLHPNKKVLKDPEPIKIADVCDPSPNRARSSKKFENCCEAPQYHPQQCEHQLHPAQNLLNNRETIANRDLFEKQENFEIVQNSQNKKYLQTPIGFGNSQHLHQVDIEPREHDLISFDGENQNSNCVNIALKTT
jgi:hypothetical protein